MDEETTLRFLGDWSPYLGVPLALLGGLIAFWLYYRETRRLVNATRWILPLLRSLAITLILLILIGPVLRHEKTIRELGRLFVLVDASESMALTDESMSLPRKVAIMNAMDLLPADPLLQSIGQAQTSLKKAEKIATDLIEDRPANPKRPLYESLLEYSEQIAQVIPTLTRVQSEITAITPAPPQPKTDEERRKQAEEAKNNPIIQQQEAIENVRKLIETVQKPHFVDVVQAVLNLKEIDQVRTRTTEWLSEKLRHWVEHRLEGDTEEAQRFKNALEQFDQTTRWERLQQRLLDPERGLLPQLAQQHDMELVSLNGPEVEPIWWKRRAGRDQSGPLPEQFEIIPQANSTDLSTPIRQAIADQAQGAAVILLTDGRHNHAAQTQVAAQSPEEMARVMKSLQIPLFSIGFGAEEARQDFSISEVIAPEIVSPEGTIRGQIVIVDGMDPGIPYEIKLDLQGKTVWTQTFETKRSGENRLPFEVSVKQLLENLPSPAPTQTDPQEVVQRAVPLRFEVSAHPQGYHPPSQTAAATVVANTKAHPEKILTNNQQHFTVQTLHRKRKLLLLDGRPRWESRYILTLFERNPDLWEVNALMLSNAENLMASWPRGNEKGSFPAKREQLYDYDLIIVGDLDQNTLNEEEREWITDFVAKRGGGLILIDGQHHHLRQWDEPLKSLIPVTWNPELESADLLESNPPTHWHLTELGNALEAFRFSADPAENLRLWSEFQPPHWFAHITPHPDAEVLLQSETEDGEKHPLYLRRRFGSGQILYTATDESWRLRYMVAERYHEKLWNQTINWLGEPPFAAASPTLALGSDQLIYHEDQSAELRVRLRNEDGEVIHDARLDAILLRDGQFHAEIPLQPDENMTGLYRVRTGALPPGDYTVQVRESGQEVRPETMTLHVTAPPAIEFTQTTLNRPSLEAMATLSGGRFYFEEQMEALPDLLHGLDRKQTIITETQLWSSYWWFTPIIVFLTAEWILRKRSGMV